MVSPFNETVKVDILFPSDVATLCAMGPYSKYVAFTTGWRRVIVFRAAHLDEVQFRWNTMPSHAI